MKEGATPVVLDVLRVVSGLSDRLLLFFPTLS